MHSVFDAKRRLNFLCPLPLDLDEAALIDGCSLAQVFRHVALFLARAGIVVAAILSFLFSWSNLIFGVVLVGRQTRPLLVAVYNVLTFEQIAWGSLAAAALIVILPVLVLSVFAQRGILAGFATGGVNGRRPHWSIT